MLQTARANFLLELVSRNFPMHVPLSFLLPLLSSCRIKQPALKLAGNKDTICKPCHMTPLASVCGSDGHTYSSVVRSPGPRCGGKGGGGLHLKPQGAERMTQPGPPVGLPVLKQSRKCWVSTFSMADHRRLTCALSWGCLRVPARPYPWP